MATPIIYQQKRALIIGINDYRRSPLNYCINDAIDLTTTLEGINFTVLLGQNCKLEEFYNMIDVFAATVENDDLVLFYFAGHGKQNDDENYLLPSDYRYNHRGSEQNYIVEHAVSVKYIMDKIADTNCCIVIYLLDCCRQTVRTRAMNGIQGLSAMNAPLQTLIVYTCAPGTVVLDETQNNRNASFMESLLKYITTTNRDIEDIMKDVASAVHLQTNGFQLPYRTSSLIGKVFLVTNNDQGINVIPPITNNTQWKQDGTTVAGGNEDGNHLDQLSSPHGLYIDNDRQSVYIADFGNDRIVEWKLNANVGQVVAGGNGQGIGKNQLNEPKDVLVDTKNNVLIICDTGNKRIIEWSRQNNNYEKTIISDIDCHGLSMDKNGNLYVSDSEKNVVKRWKRGETNGTIVAGGNGEGSGSNQLDHPTYIFVDEKDSVYVADLHNHRVMKWTKDALEGIVVAGGQGEGHQLTQLRYPMGVIVDRLDNVYVADSGNNRIVCWLKDFKQGRIIAGGTGEGQQANQLNSPSSLSFDRENNLYVVDFGDNRIQKFHVII